MPSPLVTTVSNISLPVDPPPDGHPVEIAPGILWLRLPLPFRLDHVNVYLIRDGAGYALFDTGISDRTTRDIWTALLPLPITRIIVSHYHPDHAGMAGWLAERTGAPLLMPATEYLTSLLLTLDPAIPNATHRTFYRAHGLDPATTESLLTLGHRYLEMVAPLPRTYRRLLAGETLHIDNDPFHVLTAGGHAPEQAMLHAPSRNILLCADQVLARISPNIGVDPQDPDGDPLAIYLRSLATLRATISPETLVLPGHDLPFIGLHTRIDELTAHHQARCDAIESACRLDPQTVTDLLPVIFGRPIHDPHQLGFAFNEALAHLNFMRHAGRLHQRDGRFEAT